MRSPPVPPETSRLSALLQQAMFAGEGAATADREALARAQAMQQSGAPPDQIWSQTGWFLDEDQRWKFEFPDDGAQIQDGRFVHPELERAYPGITDRWDFQIADLNAGRRGYTRPNPEGPGGEIRVSRWMFPDERLSTGLHEFQHAIQVEEGFARGGNPLLAGTLVDGGHSLENQELRDELDLSQLFKDVYADRGIQSIESTLREMVMENNSWGGNADEYLRNNEISPVFPNNWVAASLTPTDFANELAARRPEMAEQHPDLLSRARGAFEQMQRGGGLAETQNSMGFSHDKWVNPNYPDAISPNHLVADLIFPRQDEGLGGPEDPFEAYRALHGEVQARNTQERYSLTPEQRAATHPFQTRDVPLGQSLIYGNRPR